MIPFTTQPLPPTHDAIAPDGSEIRLLGQVAGGSFVHCTLPPGQTSLAVRHQTVDEIWFFLEGQGQVWRQQDAPAEPVEVRPGMCLTVPLGTRFQFRNTGETPLTFVIATMPPWPGEGEAVRVEGYW